MSLKIGDENDGSVPVELRGRVTWEITANVPPSCLGSDVDSCERAQLFLGPTGPLHNSSSRGWLPSCEAGACGGCECKGQSDDDAVLVDSTTPYCVDGDVLWVGGAGKAGEAKVSYKFRRRSCSGTPVPCAARTPAECTLGGDCRRGRCRAANGNVPQCAEAELEVSCQSVGGCVWEPDACTGSARCNFITCEQVPGCKLGPPAPPRCAGQAYCGGSLKGDDCHEPGCSVRPCSGNPDVACDDLDELLCLGAPGCTWDGRRCTGLTDCNEQTNVEACWPLPYCEPLPNCAGTPARSCSDLSAQDCHGLYGCFLEW